MRCRLLLLALALLGALCCTASALAAHRAPVPRAHEKLNPGSARLYLYDAFFVHRAAVAVPGRPLHVTAIVSPYVPGQTVALRAWLGRRRISSQRLRVRALPGGHAGRVLGTVVAHGAGVLHLQVIHARSRRMAGFAAHRALRELAVSTSDPGYVSLVQQRLAARHVAVAQSGRWDLSTELAVDAYHRLLRRGTSTTLDGRTLSDLLDGHGSLAVRYPGDGRHAEGDLTRQLLALDDGGHVEAIYPISSGKPTTPTILGRYRIYRRSPGYLPDGMYYSDFFIRGYAIHGYDPAPDYPASHGCMRLPISDAITVFDWLGYGDWVDVYDE